MKQSVQVSQLKARLSEYLRVVRRGGELVVMDRKTPVARIVAHDESPGTLAVRPPRPGAPPPGEIVLPPPLPDVPDALALLALDRARER